MPQVFVNFLELRLFSYIVVSFVPSTGGKYLLPLVLTLLKSFLYQSKKADFNQYMYTQLQKKYTTYF